MAHCTAYVGAQGVRPVGTQRMKDSTAFVTGATGLLGGALARRLAAEDARVRALVRSPHKADFIRGVDGIEMVQGDVTDAARMRELIAGCDIVFHCAAAFGNREQQQRVNVEGTRCVMQASAEAQTKRVIHVSSLAVYGYAKYGILREDEPIIPTAHEPYSQTKAEGETVVREIASQHHISYVIIRPGMIYGPRAEQWTDRMFRLARRRPVIWIGDGGGSTFPVHVDDVVDMMIVTATHPAAHNQTFNCVHPVPVTWREFLLGYAKLAGHQSWLGIPPALAVVLARIVGALSLPGSRAKAAPDALQGLYSQRSVDMSKARTLLDWQPKIDLETGIQTCVPYLQAKGWLN
jgi:nucleoside-diphosphate-sugar epimerase